MTAAVRSVCLYCGSRPGRSPAYADAAETLGTALGRGGWSVVYGAGDLGLMGRAARAAQLAGARVTGFIPRHLFELEAGRPDLHSLIVTETMHERKKLMFTNSDAVVALPGGAGTLDELVEVLTWRQLGLHDKPIVLFDINGFWQPFHALIEHMTREGFIAPPFADYMTWAGSVEEVIAALGAEPSSGHHRSLRL